MTTYWHRENTDKVYLDAGGGQSNGVRQIASHGFDLSGFDFHTAGTLDKNISFYLLPSSDNTAAFHFEQVFARLDNIFDSTWFNVKLGKFELDNLLSEKRILTLTSISGVYQLYHFSPVGDSNTFGQIGDNQLGLEWLGHSYNDRTRVSAAMLSSTDGNVNLLQAMDTPASLPPAKRSTPESSACSVSACTYGRRGPNQLLHPEALPSRVPVSATRASLDTVSPARYTWANSTSRSSPNTAKMTNISASATETQSRQPSQCHAGS